MNIWSPRVDPEAGNTAILAVDPHTAAKVRTVLWCDYILPTLYFTYTIFSLYYIFPILQKAYIEKKG